MADDLDTTARARALDPRLSCLVRAPAGAGKTELLVQRYLALLATATAPEAVVAITFTVKAAGEMHERIVAALTSPHGAADSEHAQRTQALVHSVLERDRERGWNIPENPARLQIQTIDALCMRLARRLPVLARCPAGLLVTERPRPLYRAAAALLLEEIEEPVAGDRLVLLLRHAGGDEQRLIELVADMLGERDRWLRHVVSVGRSDLRREALERNLESVVCAALEAVHAAIPAAIERELPTLAAHAAHALARAGIDSPLLACAGLEHLPRPAPDALPAWLGLAELLLTGEGEARRQLRPEYGFGATEDAREAMQAVLQRLPFHEEFVRRLASLRRLPPMRYSEEQWAVCEALFGLLPRAAACLRLVFEEAGAVDFTEIAHAALRALGPTDAPTDLALALDQRIDHLLVDEFQDTSYTQLELLERLTAGWQPGDGRTLLLVGDPMQSIYRFREAEVALFARAEDRGIGALTLTPLRLTRNFRAQAGLVDWVNTTFPRLFTPRAAREDASVGFDAAEPARTPLEGLAVTLHAQGLGDAAGEARRVVDLVTESRRAEPGACIGVLARAREHLSATMLELRGRGLAFRAVDVEGLAQVPVVQDLHALTRALLHLGDRVAWLAVLRAPWCGLTLADLHALAHEGAKKTVFEAMAGDDAPARMSEDGRRRLARVRDVLAHTLAERGRAPLRTWVEGAWIALGGAACIRGAAERSNAQRYLRLLEDLDHGGEPRRLEEIGEALAELYADPDPAADESLQLMTIHRAKGLEFDIVIVPGLERSPGRGSERLLTVLERPAAARSDLYIAPIGTAGETDPIGAWLRRVNAEYEDEEAVRLLYVAATRARNRLHLLGALRSTPGAQPRRDSLLARLWPALADEFRAAATSAGATPATSAAASTPRAPIRRLPSGWRSPEPQPTQRAAPRDEAEVPVYAWATDIARHVGGAVHRALDRIGKDGLPHWDALGDEGQRKRLRSLLRELGTAHAQLDAAVERAHAAIANTLADARGRWIFHATHGDARSEYELSGLIDDRLVTATLDRTFVDDVGVRWIVDFKTGAHEGGDPERFLGEEVERYRPQLDRYAQLMRRLDPRPLRVGLYFPLLRAWREWEP